MRRLKWSPSSLARFANHLISDIVHWRSYTMYTVRLHIEPLTDASIFFAFFFFFLLKRNEKVIKLHHCIWKCLTSTSRGKSIRVTFYSKLSNKVYRCYGFFIWKFYSISFLKMFIISNFEIVRMLLNNLVPWIFETERNVQKQISLSYHVACYQTYYRCRHFCHTSILWFIARFILPAIHVVNCRP